MVAQYLESTASLIIFIGAIHHLSITICDRFVLNIKGLPYKTVWVEYPDIKALCEKIGATPTNSASAQYTLPNIHDPSTNTTISDSLSIARYLDDTYPSTIPMFPLGSHALQDAFQYAVMSTVLPKLNMIMMPVACAALNPRSQEYFRRTRESPTRFGKRLEDLSPVGAQRDADWKGVREGYGHVDGWMKKNRNGTKYVMGDSISYADVTIASLLVFLRLLWGEQSEEWGQVRTWQEGRWAEMSDEFKRYEQIL